MKKSLVIALALMLVLAFASSAMAAQALQNGQYLSTTATGGGIYTNSADNINKAGFTRTMQANKFTVDGYTYYPYEIYLPNEENPSAYRIHSNYTANTDACASCHATHTAVGESLLQWYSVYETCMACHDGTLGNATYNVEAGEIGNTGAAAFGGMFGTGAEQGLSNHNVTGSMEIAAAPGGTTVDTEKTNGAHGAVDANTRWVTEFGCQSCHTPHGQGGNARILHPDPNFAASWAAEEKADANTYYVDPASGKVYTNLDYTTQVYILKGYPYEPAVSDAAYTISNVSGYSVVYEADGVTEVSASGITVEGVAGLQVKMQITNYLAANESVTHVYGMNFYCGACHTDYNTAAFTQNSSAAEETGVYAQAHRHQMGMDWYSATEGLAFETTKKAGYAIGSMECLTCHVAHGVSEDYWTTTLITDSTPVTGWTQAMVDTGELSGSSALKRMPNMGTCEACHAKAEGNEGYNANAGFATPSGTADVTDAAMPNTYNWDARTADYAASDLGWVGNKACEGCHEEYVKGWEATTHATSSHTGATGCGRCHNPGNSIMGATGTFATPAVAGTDAGITCESCHGTGARHVKAPSTNNIFNPATKSIERQAIECGRCHDMYVNNVADVYGNLAATSGMGVTTVAKMKTSAVEAQAGWSVGFRVYRDDPAKFADATQFNTTSNHYGGAWGYADSKHFIGTGTASAPNGIVSCNTCHDMHSEKHTGLLKYSYEQICASCHDSSASLAIDVAMPSNNWNRHQIEANDNAHSFKFGAPATIAAVDIETVNLEAAITSAAGLLERTTPAVTTVYSVWDATYANADSTVNDNLWRGGQTGGGGMGKRIKAYSDLAKTNRVYNNYAMDWEVVAKPAGVTIGTDVVLVPEGGALEFTNPGTGAAGVAAGDYDKFSGVYTLKYTNRAFPAITGTVSFTVKKTPLIP